MEEELNSPGLNWGTATTRAQDRGLARYTALCVTPGHEEDKKEQS